MPNNISAYALYNGATNDYLGDTLPLVSLDCALFAAWTPRLGYLKRRIEGGVAGGSIIQYLPTFDSNDPAEIALTLQYDYAILEF